MTIIAVQGRAMAADSASFQNDMMFPSVEPKIARAPDGSLIGACGAAGDCIAIRQWARDGMDAAKPPKLSFVNTEHDNSVLWLWLSPDGIVRMGDCTMMTWLVSSPVVIGIGAQYVHGLLDGGATLEGAVRLAIERIAYLGGDVQVERLPKPDAPSIIPYTVQPGETPRDAMDRALRDEYAARDGADGAWMAP